MSKPDSVQQEAEQAWKAKYGRPLGAPVAAERSWKEGYVVAAGSRDQLLADECEKEGLPYGLAGLLRHIYGNRDMTFGAKDYSINLLEARLKSRDQQFKELREALGDIVNASRDDGLAAMCNWMRERASAALAANEPHVMTGYGNSQGEK